ncbi:MAG: hypothetical protein J3K34DRAFT_523516 [Monoraphidium minutum]|nr:MAG: hypothetical protein J3K34DRAFT_523516 [Monoraphidium minutum]
MAFSSSAGDMADADMLYIEGRDVTASQELDAMEDDAPSRLHLGFSDPMHSQDDFSFHHEAELVPPGGVPGAGAARARVRAPPPPPAPAPAAAAQAPVEAADVAQQDEEEGGEEDGWAKWEKFQTGALPPEEMAYYRGLQQLDAAAAGPLPEWMAPQNDQDRARMKWNLEFQDKLVRLWEEEDYEDQAWAIHHYQNETGINRYMNARQMAGYMAAVELEDHQKPHPERMRFPSWARAEHRWAHDYDAFNDHLAENMESYIITLPPGAEDAEDIDILDDVLLLSDDAPPAAGGAAAAALAAGEGEGPAAEGLDQWLVGVLPGAGGGGGGGDAKGFAEDLLGDEAAEEDDVAA